MLKNALSLKKLSIGSWLMSDSPIIAEIMSISGIEWLVIDQEHTCTDLTKIQELIHRIQKNKIESLVRIAKNDEVIIKKILDAGANGIIVPMIKSLEEAKNVINHTFYPPTGKRGVGLFTAQSYGLNFEKYVTEDQYKTIVILQVEHIDILEDLEDICKLEHIDGFIVGPYDFSASMGKPGQFDDPEVQSKLAKVEEIITASKKSLGFHVVQPDVSKVNELFLKQYSFFAFSIDHILINKILSDQIIEIKKSVKK